MLDDVSLSQMVSLQLKDSNEKVLACCNVSTGAIDDRRRMLMSEEHENDGEGEQEPEAIDQNWYVDD